jgi:hypothetical protein
MDAQLLDAFPVGTRVRLSGLIAKPSLNGLFGTVHGRPKQGAPTLLHACHRYRPPSFQLSSR